MSDTNRLLNSDDAFRLLLKGPGMVMVVDNSSNVIIEANVQFLDNFGYTRDQVIGRTTDELELWVDETYRKTINSVLIRDGVIEEYIAPLRTSRGDVRSIQISATVTDHDGRRIVIAFFHDVTDRLRAEQALDKALLLLERAEEMARIGNWEFNFATGTVTGSPGAHRIYGVDAGSLSVDIAESIPLPEYRPILDQAREEAIRSGVPYDVEFKISRVSDGSIVDVHSRAVWDAQEKTLFGIIRDITEEKKARAVLESLNTDLQVTVGQTRTYLEDARRAQLRAETVARLNSLVAHLAHEMNTPLGILITASSHLAGMEDSVDESRMTTIRLIEDMSNRLANLISRFRRLGVAELPSERSMVSQEIPDFFERLIGTFEMKPKPGKRITVECDGPPWTETFDFIPVAEAVTELVQNALIHNKEDVNVRVIPRRSGKWLEITIADDGKGIDRSVRDTLFEPFVTTALGMGRPGLGLSVIHNQIVEQLGGSISLEDNDSKGCRFVIRVPRSKPT